MALSSAIAACPRCRHRLSFQSFAQFRRISSSIKSHAEAKSTFYDVLGVEKEASGAEIKSAYFKLSKSLHPDVSPDDPEKHELFVQLNEAYGTLSKPLLRKEYDISLLRPNVIEIRVQNGDVSPDNPFGGQREAEWYPRTHIYREGTEEDVHSNYYGIKGVRRVNNFYIVYGCVLFILAGGIFHFFVIKQSSQYATERLDAKDRKIAEMYNQAKEQARINGPKKQMEILRERNKEFRLKLQNLGNDS